MLKLLIIKVAKKCTYSLTQIEALTRTFAVATLKSVPKLALKSTAGPTAMAAHH